MSTVTAKAGNLPGSYPGGTFASRVLVDMTLTLAQGLSRVNQNAQSAASETRALLDRLRAALRIRGQVTLAGRGLVQANGSSNEGRECLLIDFIVLVEVDCAPGVAFEA